MHNIFNVKQNGKNLYECVNTTYDNSKLTLINTINTKIYIHKNLQLCIDDNNQKKYIKVNNDGHNKKDNILIQKTSICEIERILFPLIDKYDNIITRQTKIYHNTQNNIYLNFICDTFTNDNKPEKISYLQIEGNFTYENIFNLLNEIFKL
jgi:hypothetical protein